MEILYKWPVFLMTKGYAAAVATAATTTTTTTTTTTE
jgi:hypothetical protein